MQVRTMLHKINNHVDANTGMPFKDLPYFQALKQTQILVVQPDAIALLKKWTLAKP